MHRVDTFLAQLPELMLLTFFFFSFFSHFPLLFHDNISPPPSVITEHLMAGQKKSLDPTFSERAKKKTKKKQTRREKQSVQTASDPEKNGFRFAFLSPPPPTLPSSSYTSSRSNLIQPRASAIDCLACWTLWSSVCPNSKKLNTERGRRDGAGVGAGVCC